MERQCTRKHDESFPQENIVAFCSNLLCQVRFACIHCYNDYHSDHMNQLIPLQNYSKFLQFHIDQLRGPSSISGLEQISQLKKALVSVIEMKFQKLETAYKQLIGYANIQQSEITEQILTNIVTANYEGYDYLRRFNELSLLLDSLKTEHIISKIYIQMNNLQTPDCIYSGEMTNSKREGYGVAQFRNGDRYQGNWKNDKLDGYGVYQYAIGSRYNGYWVDGKKNGIGQYTWVQQQSRIQSGNQIQSYIGDFKNDMMNGQGQFKYINGDQYTGNWMNSLSHGAGTYREANGNKYEGAFQNHKRSGIGRYTWSNGHSEAGQWVDDKKIGIHEYFIMKKHHVSEYVNGVAVKTTYFQKLQKS